MTNSVLPSDIDTCHIYLWNFVMFTESDCQDTLISTWSAVMVRTRTKFGGCAFSSCGLTMWNSLLSELADVSVSASF